MNIHFARYINLLDDLNIIKVLKDNNYIPDEHLKNILEQFHEKLGGFPYEMLPVVMKNSSRMEDILKDFYRTYAGDCIYFSATRHVDTFNEDSFNLVITNAQLKAELAPKIRKIKMALKRSNAQKVIDCEAYSTSISGSYKIARDLLSEMEVFVDKLFHRAYGDYNGYRKISTSHCSSSKSVIVYQDQNYHLLRLTIEPADIKLAVFAEDPNCERMIRSRLSHVFDAVDRFNMSRSIEELKGKQVSIEGYSREWRDDKRQFAKLTNDLVNIEIPVAQDA